MHRRRLVLKHRQSIYKLLTESWDGTSWTVLPTPSRGGIQSALLGVSCASASTCTAAGFYDSSSGYARTLIESWDGTSWSRVPSPTRGPHNNDLNGVSCASAATCTAAGYYSNSSFAIKTLTKSGTASG
jgi:hypothetical protein